MTSSRSSEIVAAAQARVEELLAFHTPRAVRFNYDDVKILFGELERVQEDNRLLRQKLELAWADVAGAR